MRWQVQGPLHIRRRGANSLYCHQGPSPIPITYTKPSPCDAIRRRGKEDCSIEQRSHNVPTEHGRIHDHSVARGTERGADAPTCPHRQHVVQVELASHRLGEHPAHLRGLLRALFVRVAILLQTFDAVLDLRPPETREKHARLDDADVHDRRVQPLQTRP